MKKLILFLIISLGFARITQAQQLPPYDRTRQNQVLDDRATWSRYFMGIPHGAAPSFPAYVPDSVKCGALYYRTTDSSLYVYNCATLSWEMDRSANTLRLGGTNQTVTQVPTFSNGANIDGNINGTSLSIIPTSQTFFQAGNSSYGTSMGFHTDFGANSAGLVFNSNNTTHPVNAIVYAPAATGDSALYEVHSDIAGGFRKILTAEDLTNLVQGQNSTRTTLQDSVLYTNPSGFYTYLDTSKFLPSGINVNGDYITSIKARHENPSNYKGLELFNQIGADALYYRTTDGFTPHDYKLWDSGNLTTSSLNTIYGYAPVSLSVNNTWTAGQTFNQPLNFGANTYYTVTGIGPVWLTNLGANLNKLLAPTSTGAARTWTLQDKSGTIALTNDNISEFTNDAGYLTSSTGVTSITGTPNQVIASNSTGALTLSLPQSIATTSSPTFASGNFTGTLKGANIYGTSATPSVSAQPGAGTGATVSVVGTNSSGVITVVTGTSPTASASIVNLTLAGGFAFPNNATGIAQASPTASLLPAGVTLVTDSTTTVFQINSAGGALAASTTYKINYVILGY